VVHDVSEWPTPFLSMHYGYVTFDTMVWLGEPRSYSSMLLRVAGDASNQEHNKVVAREVYDKIRKAGLDPSFPKVPEPDRPPTEFIISAITSLMGLLGLFAILLSGFLVTNTISALLAQQIKQIGMMKAVGARATQIMTIYIVLVLCFGLLALVPAIPLAQAATGVFSAYLSAFLNFDIANAQAPAYVVALQVAIGLLVPIVAALIPIYSGTRITIREALSNIGRSSGYGSGFIDRAIQHVRGLPRPLLLSLRNSFRRKGRVALTLATLTLAGAFFISVFSVKASLEQTIEEIVDSIYAYDLNVYLDRNYRIETLQYEARQVPGVVRAEATVQTSARRIHTDNPDSRNVLPDDREGANLQLSAIAPDTQTIQPIILKGRWLLPDDENALVISSGMLHENSDLKVDDEMILRVKDEKTRWRIVGIMQGIGEARWAYTNLDYYSRLVGEVGQSGYLRVVTEGHTIAEQLATAKRLEEHFQQHSLDVSSTQSMAEMSEADKQMIAMITASLMFMAMLVAVVGSLGLAGMMTLNVIERVREIGIMRAIGASDTSILQIFIVEGVIIGLVSWSLGALLAMPIARGLSTALGMMLVSAPLSFDFSLDGIIVWLVLSFVMAAVASFVPAWRATRVSVRDVLAYE
jgi:putative ABC transport system permease protein